MFRTSVGYSDHTIGFEACISAVTLGASLIEKHLTNNNLSGPDPVKQILRVQKNG